MAPGKRKKERVIRLKTGEYLALPETGEMVDLTQFIRDAIKRSGLTQYQINKLTGIPQGGLSLFLNGGDIRLETASKLAHVLGLELIENPDKAPRRQQADD